MREVLPFIQLFPNTVEDVNCGELSLWHWGYRDEQDGQCSCPQRPRCQGRTWTPEQVLSVQRNRATSQVVTMVHVSACLQTRVDALRVPFHIPFAHLRCQLQLWWKVPRELSPSSSAPCSLHLFLCLRPSLKHQKSTKLQTRAPQKYSPEEGEGS